jgi:hypothetical protein
MWLTQTHRPPVARSGPTVDGKDGDMRTADIVCAVVMLLIGLLVMGDSIRLEIGWGMEGPRAGFYPFVMSLGVVVGSLIVLVQAIQRKGIARSKAPFIQRAALRPVLQVVIPATCMVLLTHFVGLYVAAGLYMAVYMRWIGRHRWLTVLALAVGLPALSYLVFERIFLIPMPAGSLQAFLPF